MSYEDNYAIRENMLIIQVHLANDLAVKLITSVG